MYILVSWVCVRASFWTPPAAASSLSLIQQTYKVILLCNYVSMTNNKWQRHDVSSCYVIMSPRLTINGRGMMCVLVIHPFNVRPSVQSCPLTPVSCDAIRPSYFVERFQWNLAEILIMWMGTAENVFKVRGQRSKVKVISEQMCASCNGEGVHFDSVVSRLILIWNLTMALNKITHTHTQMPASVITSAAAFKLKHCFKSFTVTSAPNSQTTTK